MRNALLVIGSLSLFASAALADAPSFKGSDTLAGVVRDAIAQSGMDGKISYAGGGSGGGEAALVAKQQGIAPMSRAFNPGPLDQARAAGILPVGHVIGLDGIGIFVNASNATASVTLDTLNKIYTCSVTKWEQVPGSGRTGEIRAYRRDDASGTTDTFKHLVKVTAFGACVQVLPDTDDIAQATAGDQTAIGYSGMTAHRDGNKALAVAKDAASQPVAPTVATIRAKTYPLARDLYVYEATGSFRPSAVEQELLGHLLDRSLVDPILERHDFYTLD